MPDTPWKQTPEGDAPDFVYTIYIAAKIDTVWNGLIDEKVTSQYWGRRNTSDWKEGSKWKHVRTDGSDIVDVHGQVLECDPPKKLVVTWNGRPDSKTHEPAPSQVSYDLVELGPDTKLTVTHAKLTKGSWMNEGVRNGWPALLSNLKSLLETGKVLSEDKWGGAKQEHPDDEA